VFAPDPIVAAFPMNPDWHNLTDPVFHWAAQRPQAVALRQSPEVLS